MNIFVDSVNQKENFIVKYYVESSDKSNLRDVAWNIAVGQSVGNPNVRNKWETDELFEKHSCKIIGDESFLSNQKSGDILIAFPIINTDWAEDGISHLLCQVMGGQLDIDIIKKCHLLHIEFPKDLENKYFRGPKFGIEGIRKYTKVFDKPLLGGIVKPKTGVSPDVLFDMVKEMVDGGVNFIKEDEILSNPSFCKLDERLPKIAQYCRDNNVIYCACINADATHVLSRVKQVHALGGNGLHLNFWSGLGTYRCMRELDLPLFIHFQKSGDKILTNKNHDYHISWNVMCDLAGLSGVDFIHAGMYGGYLSDSESELRQAVQILHKRGTMPAFSCGMHPGLVDVNVNKFGIDFMANVGGAIHGHSQGSLAGAKAMRQAIDKNYGDEYYEAIKKWGLVTG